MTIHTRLARLPRHGALGLVLCATLAGLLLALVSAQMSLPPPSAGPFAKGDAQAYAAIITRMRGGEGYYQAVHAVLPANGYLISSVFNWRTPFYPSAIAVLPSLAWMQALVGAIAVAGVLLAHAMIRSDGVWLAGGAAIALGFGFAMIGTSQGILFAEIPAGALILCSILVRMRGWWSVAVATGILALFVRELALVYVLVCMVLAVRERCWRESAAWAVGLLFYLIYFSWHAAMVAAELGPASRGEVDNWLHAGDLAFVLGTARFNGVLFALPGWVSAALLPLALLGLFAWPKGALALTTVCAYLAAFAFAGKPSNLYWGAMYAPLVMLGICWAVPAVVAGFTPRRSSAAGHGGEPRSGSSPQSVDGSVR